MISNREARVVACVGLVAASWLAVAARESLASEPTDRAARSEDARLLAADAPPPAKAPFDAEQAGELQQRWAKHIGREVHYTNSIGMKFALLPPGEFTMGRTEEQFDELLEVVDADPEMKKNRGGQIVWSMLMMPAHRVRLTRPFYLGTTEVSVAQFRAFADASGYKTEAEQGLNGGVPYKGGRPISTWRKPMAWRKNYTQQDDEPVMHLCWNDCVEFCKWLGEQEGVEFGLPTEAEWEYACRAGTTTPWSFGDHRVNDADAGKYAVWSSSVEKFDTPQRVAQRQPNPFGLYDMHGNMWEYVADWWHRYSYKEASLNDPTGPVMQSEKNDLRRIIRGSSFDWGRWGGDSAYRMRITQRSNQHPHMSFRVAMRIKDVAGVPPAIDPDEERRQQRRDPGAGSEEVAAALKAATTQETADGKPLPKELTITLNDHVKIEFVLIPAGSFMMGSGEGDKDELPLHRVVISKPFYMARHELTQSQWEAIMGKHQGLAQLTEGGDHEMVGPAKAMNLLSWNDCQNFVRKLKERAGGHMFALPTEAQWEYACRAGSTTAYHFGDDASQLGEYAYFQGNMNWPGQPGYQGKAFYHDVGQKKPNAFGLYDMHGGVWEWCADRYQADYYFDAPLVDPTGPDAGRFRVLRGGSWFRYARFARSSYRKFFHPAGDGDAVTAYINDFGCRLVINLDGDLDDGDSLCMIYSGSGKGGGFGLAMSADGVKWNRYGDRPLLRGIGGSMDPCLRKFDGQYTLWYVGQQEESFRIFRATSPNGTTWTRHPQPVLPSGGPGDFDETSHAGPVVLKLGERYYMFYLGGNRDGWRMGLATSHDGLTWSKSPANPILDVGGANEWDGGSLMSLDVLWMNDKFHVWYAAHAAGLGDKDERDMGIRIGYAVSRPDVAEAGNSD